jgi:hypothetical protein
VTSPDPIREAQAYRKQLLDALGSARYRWVVAHDEPELIGYDQDLWADSLRHNEDAPADLVALFEALRAANLALWRRSTPEQRARVGRHRERDAESYELMYWMIGGHDRIHLDQADRPRDGEGRLVPAAATGRGIVA